ncbi:MAG: hypothetical protein K9N23_09960 [Akkermansiaceae bacterium]|nr:hypothetical protein [Akkermansiaceae bacterium]MCF7732004.1 hypothetical protein [Akkermansiaceae bacterium]
MNQHHKLTAARLLAAFAFGMSPAIAAEPQPDAVPLNEAGNKLEAAYAAMLKSLKKEIAKALPQSDEPQQADSDQLLTSDKLDAQLVKFALLSHATPGGLAGFSQQGQEQQSLIETLLANAGLMKQIVVAGGPTGGKYGEAMKIYSDIQKASTHAKDGILQRFALGTSLEHAVPVGQRNPVDQTNAPATVDPVKRYLGYEKAFLAGELDPGFKDLTVWDCRMIGNGDESDEVLAWGREMLRNYLPDHITNPDYRWRYVELVKTDVKYGSKDQKNDSPSLGFYQNILSTGGICGRRAFFGRFILRCFGIPCLARPQPGHATLVHWTPNGWVICLGASWGNGKVNGAPDTEFLTLTQARMTGDAYLQVLRAQWIGAAIADKGASTTSFWNGVAGTRQQQVIEKAKAATIAAVGTDIGEANESKEKEIIKTAAVSEADRQIVTAADGVITIPAVACSTPTNSTPKIRFMKSHLGGMQLHYGRLLEPETFEYTFDAPAAGKYALSARVVTVSPDQHLFVATNDSPQPVDITAPYTLGKWDMTPPVEISLAKGTNVLRFSRPEPVKGMTIKDFALAPVR